MCTKLLLAVINAVAVAGSAFAQEPLRLPEPDAKALPRSGGVVIELGEEEVQGRKVSGPRVHAKDGHGHHSAAVDPIFGGYPYSGGWHAGYHHPLWDRPVALVVPPTANYQTIWSWGVSTTQITPIYPQYGGPVYGMPGDFPGPYRTMPYWPWDTRQFGVYYIRGPW
jgi:hypothetical protein